MTISRDPVFRVVVLYSATAPQPSSLPRTRGAGAMRWTAGRKAEVVRQVAVGELTEWEALERYELSLEEFCEWRDRVAAHGIVGLQTTRLQDFRHRARSRKR